MTREEALENIEDYIENVDDEILLSYDDGIACKEELGTLGVDIDELETLLFRIGEDKHDKYNKQYVKKDIKLIKKMLKGIKELHELCHFNIDDETLYIPC